MVLPVAQHKALGGKGSGYKVGSRGGQNGSSQIG